MEIERSDIHHFRYFEYGEAFYGSHKGMRYRISIEPLENIFFIKPEERGVHSIKAWAWPEPLNFASAKDKESKEFDFSEEGVVEAVGWLNEQYEIIVRKDRQ